MFSINKICSSISKCYKKRYLPCLADKKDMKTPIVVKTLPALLGETLDRVAHLFVTVDAAYEDGYWWHEVQEQGLPAAKKLLDRNWYAVTVAYRNNNIIAFAGLDEAKGNNVELIRVMTHPDHTRKGAATKCITTLLDVADRNELTVWLDVLANATGAIKLYKKLGFYQFDNKPGEHSLRPAIQMRRSPKN